jgi:hypothetical protein
MANILKGEICRRDHISDEKHVLIGKAIGCFHQAHIRKRYPYIFGLGSAKTAANGSKADDTALFTLRRRSLFTEKTIAAMGKSRDNDPVPRFKIAHIATDLLNNADTFMPDRAFRIHHGLAVN